MYSAIFCLLCLVAVWPPEFARFGGFHLVIGLCYGKALWLLAQPLLLPSVGSTLVEAPTAILAKAYVLYGAMLSLTVQRPG